MGQPTKDGGTEGNPQKGRDVNKQQIIIEQIP